MIDLKSQHGSLQQLIHTCVLTRVSSAPVPTVNVNSGHKLDNMQKCCKIQPDILKPLDVAESQ